MRKAPDYAAAMQPTDRLTGSLVRLGMVRNADIDRLVDLADDTRAARLGDSGPAFPWSEANQREWWTSRVTDDDVRVFAIRLLDDDSTLLGTITLSSIDASNRVAQLGMSLPDPGHWGHGYGTDAVRLLLAFEFDDMNLHRVEMGVFAFNTRAIACYEGLGFVREGTHREYLQRDGQRHDMYLYGILEHEWRQDR